MNQPTSQANAGTPAETGLPAQTSSPTIMQKSIDRRQFLKQAGAAGVGLGVAGYFGSLTRLEAQAAASPARKIGANDRVAVAVMGTNGRGLAHVQCLTG